MKRIEFYIQHLVRARANAVVLSSEAPVRFVFPAGEKSSDSPIRHALVAQLVQESAPPEAISQLKSGNKAEYPYVDSAGNSVTVDVAIRGPQAWEVRIAPATVQHPRSAQHRVEPEIREPAPAQQPNPAISIRRAPIAPDPKISPPPSTTDNAPRAIAELSPASSTITAPPEPASDPPQAAQAIAPVATPIQVAPAQVAPAQAIAPAQVAPAQAAPAQAIAPAAAPAPNATQSAETNNSNSSPSSNSSRAPGPATASGEPKINYYLRQLVERGASDLHLSTGVAPMFRLHGEMQVMEDRPPFSDDEMRNMLMEIATDKARKNFKELNDADFAHAIPEVARFRANYFLDRKGMGAVFRQIPFEILTPEKLGVPPKVLDLCWLSKGLVVVTGPTGSGKSTTLAALVDYINRHRSDHIITIEDPIEFVHPNKKCLVNQREVGIHTMGFKNALRAALREDPDIVLVGEMRDLETISIAIETAETGHLVFGTLHTTTAPSTVDRIIDQFPADRQDQIRVMLSESLRGVVAQMLCKRNGGGRVAAYEIMLSNPAVSNLIREGKTFQLVSVMQTGKNQGMQTMNDHLTQLVQDGIVEPQEAYIKAADKISLRKQFTALGIPLPETIE